MKKININSIRKKLDILDSKILNLIKSRTLLVDKVILTKKFKNQIIDNKRIISIMKRIRAKSLKKKIDPDITKQIWKSMIRAFINYEFKNFKKK
jgi:chorismate mutase|tara:strand:+ start:1299 stop:1580 length:282 start_codon:yes stop_codon:yes gene_type:complete